ncbi:MAG: hypothetical protein RJB55_2287 [Verrucomicrobiota bacterium]|jgi:hypothetical protein
MNLLKENDLVFPLSAGAATRPALRPPSLASLIRPVHGVVLGRNSFLREWSARRAQLVAAARGPAAAGR